MDFIYFHLLFRYLKIGLRTMEKVHSEGLLNLNFSFVISEYTREEKVGQDITLAWGTRNVYKILL
jgi:hypothetical protein